MLGSVIKYVMHHQHNDIFIWFCNSLHWPLRQGGGSSMVTSGSPGGVMVRTLSWTARAVRSIPALGTILPIFNTHNTSFHDQDPVQVMCYGCWTYPLYLYVRSMPVYICSCKHYKSYNSNGASVVVCTDLSGKEPHIQVGMGSMVTSGSQGGVIVSTFPLNAKVGALIPALSTIFPIFITHMTIHFRFGRLQSGIRISSAPHILRWSLMWLDVKGKLPWL